MRETLWARFTYRPRFAFNHYVRRCCTCHSWRRSPLVPTGQPDYRVPWWQSLLAALIMAALFSGAFILLSLLIHGSVRWA